ncbi:hypothetical protein GCM10009639_14220 [Kitasatospora putterlickiae]|uniref:Uncharacterized protein n=1 Tax=Kitasatospora putterlickiae TaxID=221725 RepID=A0ABP4IIG1_9ACTN
MNTTEITALHFPTSPLALRSPDPARQATVRRFAGEQALAARNAASALGRRWAEAAGHGDRVAALAAVHAGLIDWRYRLAVRAGRRPAGVAFDPERFRTPIGEGNANFDRLGEVGRFREGSEWDEASRTYTGGASTPAYEAMVRYGLLAERRFADEGVEGDVLQNWVTLPDGRRVAGNRILRGEAARATTAEWVARVAARGVDVSRMETGGTPVYTATPAPADGAVLHAAALDLLADPGLTPDRFLLARYALYQAPRMKKGSDAVTRTFVVAVGAVLFGDQAPPLPEDVDLRCYVLGQAGATVTA